MVVGCCCCCFTMYVHICAWFALVGHTVLRCNHIHIATVSTIYISNVMCTLCQHDNKVFPTRTLNIHTKKCSNEIKNNQSSGFVWMALVSHIHFDQCRLQSFTLSCFKSKLWIYFIHSANMSAIYTQRRPFSGAIDHVKLRLLNVLLWSSISNLKHNVNRHMHGHWMNTYVKL